MSGFDTDSSVQNYREVLAIMAGPLSTRPATSFKGLVFIDTDTPSTGQYYYTGSAWLPVAGSAAGGPFLPLAAGPGNPLTGVLTFNLGNNAEIYSSLVTTGYSFASIRNDAGYTRFGVEGAIGGQLGSGTMPYSAVYGNAASGGGLDLIAAGVSRYAVSFNGNHNFKTGTATFGGAVALNAGGTSTTPATADNSTAIATTAFVKSQGYAPLNSPIFIGTPRAGTAAPGDNSTILANTSFVTTALTLYALLASPAFTGNPTAPTQAAGDNSTKLATTAYCDSLITSGTYTPTLTNGFNVTGSTPSLCHYTRVGNQVTVYGSMQVTTNTLGLSTDISLNLPIASNIGSGTDLKGVVSGFSGTDAITGFVQGNAVDNDADLTFIARLTAGTQTFYFSFMYTVI